jgi:hypothetical protein
MAERNRGETSEVAALDVLPIELELYGRCSPLVCPTCLVSGWTLVDPIDFAKENPLPERRCVMCQHHQ